MKDKTLYLLIAISLLQIPLGLAYADTDFSMFRNADGPHEGHTYRTFDHYENGIAQTEVGYSYYQGIYDIENFVITGFFTDINGTTGATITQTKELVTPDEVFSLFFENPISGDVSRFDYSIIGGQVQYPVPTPEPIPEPIPPATNGTTTEPIPIPDDFSICHKGKTITANERSFTAHESHGDTFGACEIITIPITSQYNTTTSLPDPDYSAVVDIPREIQFMKVCHSNVLTTVPVDTVRFHLKHGDQQFSCPDKGAKMFIDTVKLSDFTVEELVSLVTRIMMEIMKR